MKKMTFELDEKETARYREWIVGVKERAAARQLTERPDLAEFQGTTHDGKPVPYAGAIGGAVRFSFSPTGLGTVVTVSAWGEELDLTDYESW